MSYIDPNMDTTPLKLPIHDHPLFPSARFAIIKCEGCHVDDVTIYGGYFCNDPYCYFWFHKECAEAPLEINHPFHPQHPLLLTNDPGDGPCVLCGQKLLPPYYSCPTCEFKVDLTCGMKPSPSTVEHPMCHDHPLVFLKKREKESPCEVCKDSIGGPSYSCLKCDVYFHVDCVHLSTEVNHPCHSSHPLKLIASDTLRDDAEKSCFFCSLRPKKVLNHCSICNFTSCLGCTKNPPPLVVEHTKTHKHPLTLLSRRLILNTCDACGLGGFMLPYICLQCDFVIHSTCIGLPRVININRHDHRISFTDHLGTEYLTCGVCRKNVSKYKGAYSCSVCPNYAVHSTCALRRDIWDGVELEGIPEVTEDIAPFKVVGDNLICHFLHEKHTLKFYKEVFTPEHVRCAACSHPVGFGSIYVCQESCLVLHEKCATLPKKKRLVFGTIPFTLVEGVGVLHCGICGILSDGIMYTCQPDAYVDVHCGSLSEPFVHDGHIHPLYFDKKKGHYCNGCRNNVRDHVLRCDACDFDLCLSCASLPEKIKHRNDEHPLILCCGEKAEGKYWCDICERELDPSKWFYSCFDCGVTLHVLCVLGDFSRLQPGFIIGLGIKGIEAVLNNHNTRPLCIQCHSRCKVPVILKDLNQDNGYICSRSCLSSFVGTNI